MANFEWPWQYQFPPFFTLQSHDETRNKQIDQWSQLVLQYCSMKKISQIDLSMIRTNPLFHNDKINRRASAQLIRAVFDDLESKKNFAYLTKDKESGVLSQISFSKLALDLADWASASGNIDQVCTFYELAAGPETVGYSFNGLDESVIKQSLLILEARDRCEIIGDDGVKFL